MNARPTSFEELKLFIRKELLNKAGELMERQQALEALARAIEVGDEINFTHKDPLLRSIMDHGDEVGLRYLTEAIQAWPAVDSLPGAGYW